MIILAFLALVTSIDMGPASAVNVVPGKVCAKMQNGTTLPGSIISWSAGQASSAPVKAGIDGCANFQAVPVSDATINFSLGSRFPEIHGEQTEPVTFTKSGKVVVHGVNIVNRVVLLTMPDGAENNGSTVAWSNDIFTSDGLTSSPDNTATIHVPENSTPKVMVIYVVPRLKVAGVAISGTSFTTNNIDLSLSAEIAIPAPPTTQTSIVSVQMPDGTPVTDAKPVAFFHFLLPPDANSLDYVFTDSTSECRVRGMVCSWHLYLFGYGVVTQQDNDNVFRHKYVFPIGWTIDDFKFVDEASQSSNSKIGVNFFSGEFGISNQQDAHNCPYSTFWCHLQSYKLYPLPKVSLVYNALGFTQNITQDLVPGVNIIQLPYMPRILDLPTHPLKFMTNKPLRLTVRSVNAAGAPIKNATLSLDSTAKNTKTKTCTPSLSSKSNSQGKATFTLCLTKNSTLQVNGSGLVPSRKFTAISR